MRKRSVSMDGLKAVTDKRTFAVGGGKGGVGKSFVAVNLAVSLAKAGREVVMLDADLGGANLHTLFGILRPSQTINDFIDGRVSTLEDTMIETPVPRLRIMGGTCEVLGSADIELGNKRRLLQAIGDLSCDCLVIDVGAGTSSYTVDMFNAADRRLVVMTPELTSAQNGYGFLKVALYRRLQRAVDGHPASDRIREALGQQAFKLGSTMEKVETFLSLVEGEDAEIVDVFRMLLNEFNASIVGNMLTKDKDRNVLWALKGMVSKFLSIEADIAAAFRSNSKVRASVNTGTPLAATGVADYDVAEFNRLAKSLLGQDLSPHKALRERVKEVLTESVPFDFGLDGVEIEVEEIEDPEELKVLDALDEADANPQPSADVVPIRPLGPQEAMPPLRMSMPSVRNHRLQNELRHVERHRKEEVVHAEVQIGGHWFFGRLIDMQDGGAVVSGIHPFFASPGVGCSLRVVHMGEDSERVASGPVEVGLGAGGGGRGGGGG
ncbi:MAG: P-loop NTPase, partial [Myxococcota bacterium]